MSVTKAHVAQRNFIVMGGYFRIIAIDVKDSDVDDQITFLKNLEALWTRFKSTSEISRLNNSEGVEVEVSDLTVELIKTMVHEYKITSGYFDPTTLPLLINSGFAKSRKNANDITVIPDSAKWPGDVSGIAVSGKKVKLPVGTTLDAGGIAKGFAAELVVSRLTALGASGVLVYANGDVVVSGEAPQGGAWVIGVEDPNDPSIEIEQIRLTQGAVATSSRVHQVWEHAGEKVHHILNPLTGSTAVTDVISATVICAHGADAEALAKIPFILSIKSALEFIENAGAQCLIVDSKNKKYKTSGWKQFN